jgi:hypothetical protein
VIKEGPKFELLSRNVLEAERHGESGSSGPSPAVSEGRIFLRSPKFPFCIAKE